jgi:hypothetical protein
MEGAKYLFSKWMDNHKEKWLITLTEWTITDPKTCSSVQSKRIQTSER